MDKRQVDSETRTEKRRLFGGCHADTHALTCGGSFRGVPFTIFGTLRCSLARSWFHQRERCSTVGSLRDLGGKGEVARAGATADTHQRRISPRFFPAQTSSYPSLWISTTEAAPALPSLASSASLSRFYHTVFENKFSSSFLIQVMAAPYFLSFFPHPHFLFFVPPVNVWPRTRVFQLEGAPAQRVT